MEGERTGDVRGSHIRGLWGVADGGEIVGRNDLQRKRLCRDWHGNRTITELSRIADLDEGTGSVAGTFGTSAAITPGTTFTANVGPISATY